MASRNPIYNYPINPSPLLSWSRIRSLSIGTNDNRIHLLMSLSSVMHDDDDNKNQQNNKNTDHINEHQQKNNNNKLILTTLDLNDGTYTITKISTSNYDINHNERATFVYNDINNINNNILYHQILSNLDDNDQNKKQNQSINESTINNFTTSLLSSTAPLSSSLIIYSRGEPGLIKIIQFDDVDVDNNDNENKKRNNINNHIFIPHTLSHCPTTFDIDPETNLIYYLDDCELIIHYHLLIMDYGDLSTFSSLKSASNNQIIKSINLKALGFKQIESLSVDWRGQNIYLVDSVLGLISVIKVAKIIKSDVHHFTPVITTVHYRKRLITGLTNPKAIATDPVAGLMFFTQYGHDLYEEDYDQEAELGAWIKQAKMDGTRARIIQQRPRIKFPNSISLDVVSKRMYWCDSFHRTLESINYDGSGRILLVQSLRVGIANSVHFDPGGGSRMSLFWTELQHGTVQRFDFVNNISHVVLQEMAPLHQVKLFRPSTPKREQLNQRHQDGNLSFTKTRIPTTAKTVCDHFSLLTPNGFICDCDDDFIVDPLNRTNCIEILLTKDDNNKDDIDN